MDEGNSWFRTHWRTALALVLIFGIALFLRFYFVWDLAFTDLGLTCTRDADLPVSGGSDSYYWHRALCHSYETGRDIDFDTMLNFGWGNDNPRPPLFPWFALLAGRLVAPLFADPWHGVLFVFLASTGLFGALTVFPTYLLTKEAFGRRAGLIAAFLLAVSAAHMQRSQATDADHDAWTLFFVVTTFYFFLRSLKVLNGRRWVENWSKRDTIAAGVRAFFAENRPSVVYAILAGLSISVIALSWQGWAYVPVILLVYFVVQLFLDRVRNADPMGLTVLFAIAMLVPLLVAFPWYAARNQVRVWFDVPAYLTLAALVLGGAFTVTRDYPWTLVIPSTFVAGAAGLGVGVLVNPALANAFVSGAGYFVQTKVYETIAEAQAPGLSQLILSFGFFTFYFSLAGTAYMLWQIPRRGEASYTLIVIWAVAASFMAIAAARFIFNASPAFAVTAAFALDLIVRRADFAGMRRTYRSLVAGSWRNALRKSVKIRHVLVVFLLVGAVFLPNVWWGVDASIPFELKSRYDRQVQEALPSFLRAPGFDQIGGRGTFYFGAFGYSIPQPTEYFPAAWQWFRTQDADRPPELRPAFLSWWDYGFEAVDRGQHPTVADNFQNGFPFAGQFITAQNESLAVALLGVRLLESDLRRHGGRFSPATEGVLQAYGLPLATYRSAILRPSDFIPIVQGSPERYGTWDADMQPANAMYIYLSRETLRRVGEDRIPDFYRSMRTATGQEIGYFAVDSRLFPLSATNTGIFYAPVKLSDHRVIELRDGRTLPTDFYGILVDTDRATGVPIESVGPSDEIRNQRIDYRPAFYDSMFYRAYVGYRPRDLGFDENAQQDPGIPGFSQNLFSFPPVPAWNLTHFRLVYRTAYYNPFPDPANHTDAWRAVSVEEARHLQDEIAAGRATGVVDLSTQGAVSNGIVFVRYYDGAWVNGTVRAAGVTPISGVRVTVTDELGTPHGVATTDASGRFSLLVPFGEVTLTASAGALQPRTLVGTRILATATFPISLGQAMRENVDADGDGRPDWLLERHLDVAGRGVQGTAFFDLDDNAALGPSDVTLGGATLTFRHRDIGFERSATTGSAGGYSLPPVPAGTYGVTIAAAGRTFPGPTLDLGTGAEARRDVPVPFATLRGFALLSTGGFVPGASLEFVDEAAGATSQLTASDAGFFVARPLLVGNYTIAASKDDLAATPVRVFVDAGTRDLNLTLLPSGRVAGRTQALALDRPFATLEFQSTTDPRFVRSARSGADATFSIVLPAGDWNVAGRMYAGSALYAHLGRVSVRAGETTAYDARFVEGARIEGTVTGAGSPGAIVSAEVAFLGPGGDWWVRTGLRNRYLAFLPLGGYGVQAQAGDAGFYGDLALSRDARFDIALMTGTFVSGRAFRDLNDDGAFQVGEGVPGAALRLRDDLGRSALAVTDAGGDFVLVGFDARTYAGRIEATGYETRPIPASSPGQLEDASPFLLTPKAVEVRGAVFLGGTPLRNRPVTVQAVAVGGGARSEATATDSNGGYFLRLQPGAYEIVVDENVSASRDRRYQTLETESLLLPIGEAAVLRDVAIVERILVRGNATRTIGGSATAVAAGASFEGPDIRGAEIPPTGFELYLQPGTYNVHVREAGAPDEFLFLARVALTAPGNVSFPLGRATSVTGLALFRNVAVNPPVDISLTRTEGGSFTVTTAPGGRYTTSLLPGTYAVRVDASTEELIGDVPRFFRYTFSGSLTVPVGGDPIRHDLDLDRAFDNTTVSGSVRFGGAGADAQIAFLARGGGALEARTASGASGAYAIGLAPGTYDVYATRIVGSTAFLRTVVVPHATAHPLDIALREAFFLTGVVTNVQGARTTAAVVIEGGSRLDMATDTAGAYEALLPAGTYVVTATRSGTEQGIAVEYRASATVELQGDRVTNLPLQKVIQRSVSIGWDSAQRRTIPQGGTVTYSIEVRNTGNVAETLRLSGTPSDWTFTFLPSTVSLAFGAGPGNRTTVSVTIRAPADAPVVHAPLILSARTSDGATEGTAIVDVFIERVRSLALRVDEATGTFDGRMLAYEVEIRNAGNDRESVTVFIGNVADLGSSGWSGRLVRLDGIGTGGARISDVPVNANSTTRLRLELTSATGPSGVTVVLHAFSEDAPSVTATDVRVARLPSLTAPDGIGATGPNVVLAPAIVNSTLLTVLIAVAGAVLAGAFLTRRRR